MSTARFDVIGIDGCPGGWAVARATFEQGRARSLTVVREVQLDAVLDEVRDGSAAAAVVDMPIGLLDAGPRVAEIEARKLLGARRSSVFSTPVRAVLGARDYRDACERSRAAIGKAISQQAFHLLPKIEELDGLIRPDDQDRWLEGHPELALSRLHGSPLPSPKSTPEGRALRLGLLRQVFGPLIDEVMDRRLDPNRRPAIPVGDVLDALVLTVTARRVVDGDAVHLGDQRDRVGRRAEIVY